MCVHPVSDSVKKAPVYAPADLTDRQVAHALRESVGRCAHRMGCSHQRAMWDLALEAANRLDAAKPATLPQDGPG